MSGIPLDKELLSEQRLGQGGWKSSRKRGMQYRSPSSQGSPAAAAAAGLSSTSSVGSNRNNRKVKNGERTRSRRLDRSTKLLSQHYSSHDGFHTASTGDGVDTRATGVSNEGGEDYDDDDDDDDDNDDDDDDDDGNYSDIPASGFDIGQGVGATADVDDVSYDGERQQQQQQQSVGEEEEEEGDCFSSPSTPLSAGDLERGRVVAAATRNGAPVSSTESDSHSDSRNRNQRRIERSFHSPYYRALIKSGSVKLDPMGDGGRGQEGAADSLYLGSPMGAGYWYQSAAGQEENEEESEEEERVDSHHKKDHNNDDFHTIVGDTRGAVVAGSVASPAVVSLGLNDYNDHDSHTSHLTIGESDWTLGVGSSQSSPEPSPPRKMRSGSSNNINSISSLDHKASLITTTTTTGAGAGISIQQVTTSPQSLARPSFATPSPLMRKDVELAIAIGRGRAEAETGAEAESPSSAKLTLSSVNIMGMHSSSSPSADELLLLLNNTSLPPSPNPILLQKSPSFDWPVLPPCSISPPVNDALDPDISSNKYTNSKVTGVGTRSGSGTGPVTWTGIVRGVTSSPGLPGGRLILPDLPAFEGIGGGGGGCISTHSSSPSSSHHSSLRATPTSQQLAMTASTNSTNTTTRSHRQPSDPPTPPTLLSLSLSRNTSSEWPTLQAAAATNSSSSRGSNSSKLSSLADSRRALQTPNGRGTRSSHSSPITHSYSYWRSGISSGGGSNNRLRGQQSPSPSPSSSSSSSGLTLLHRSASLGAPVGRRPHKSHSDLSAFQQQLLTGTGTGGTGGSGGGGGGGSRGGSPRLIISSTSGSGDRHNRLVASSSNSNRLLQQQASSSHRTTLLDLAAAGPLLPAATSNENRYDQQQQQQSQQLVLVPKSDPRSLYSDFVRTVSSPLRATGETEGMGGGVRGFGRTISASDVTAMQTATACSSGSSSSSTGDGGSSLSAVGAEVLSPASHHPRPHHLPNLLHSASLGEDDVRCTTTNGTRTGSSYSSYSKDDDKDHDADALSPRSLRRQMFSFVGASPTAAAAVSHEQQLSAQQTIAELNSSDSSQKRKKQQQQQQLMSTKEKTEEQHKKQEDKDIKGISHTFTTALSLDTTTVALEQQQHHHHITKPALSTNIVAVTNIPNSMPMPSSCEAHEVVAADDDANPSSSFSPKQQLQQHSSSSSSSLSSSSSSSSAAAAAVAAPPSLPTTARSSDTTTSRTMHSSPPRTPPSRTSSMTGTPPTHPCHSASSPSATRRGVALHSSRQQQQEQQEQQHSTAAGSISFSSPLSSSSSSSFFGQSGGDDDTHSDNTAASSSKPLSSSSSISPAKSPNFSMIDGIHSSSSSSSRKRTPPSAAEVAGESPTSRYGSYRRHIRDDSEESNSHNDFPLSSSSSSSSSPSSLYMTDRLAGGGDTGGTTLSSSGVDTYTYTSQSSIVDTNRGGTTPDSPAREYRQRENNIITGINTSTGTDHQVVVLPLGVRNCGPISQMASGRGRLRSVSLISDEERDIAVTPASEPVAAISAIATETNAAALDVDIFHGDGSGGGDEEEEEEDTDYDDIGAAFSPPKIVLSPFGHSSSSSYINSNNSGDEESHSIDLKDATIAGGGTTTHHTHHTQQQQQQQHHLSKAAALKLAVQSTPTPGALTVAGPGNSNQHQHQHQVHPPLATPPPSSSFLGKGKVGSPLYPSPDPSSSASPSSSLSVQPPYLLAPGGSSSSSSSGGHRTRSRSVVAGGGGPQPQQPRRDVLVACSKASFVSALYNALFVTPYVAPLPPRAVLQNNSAIHSSSSTSSNTSSSSSSTTTQDLFPVPSFAASGQLMLAQVPVQVGKIKRWDDPDSDSEEEEEEQEKDENENEGGDKDRRTDTVGASSIKPGGVKTPLELEIGRNADFLDLLRKDSQSQSAAALESRATLLLDGQQRMFAQSPAIGNLYFNPLRFYERVTAECDYLSAVSCSVSGTTGKNVSRLKPVKAELMVDETWFCSELSNSADVYLNRRKIHVVRDAPLPPPFPPAPPAPPIGTIGTTGALHRSGGGTNGAVSSTRATPNGLWNSSSSNSNSNSSNGNSSGSKNSSISSSSSTNNGNDSKAAEHILRSMSAATLLSGCVKPAFVDHLLSVLHTEDERFASTRVALLKTFYKLSSHSSSDMVWQPDSPLQHHHHHHHLHSGGGGGGGGAGLIKGSRRKSRSGVEVDSDYANSSRHSSSSSSRYNRPMVHMRRVILGALESAALRRLERCRDAADTGYAFEVDSNLVAKRGLLVSELLPAPPPPPGASSAAAGSSRDASIFSTAIAVGCTVGAAFPTYRTTPYTAVAAGSAATDFNAESPMDCSEEGGDDSTSFRDDGDDGDLANSTGTATGTGELGPAAAAAATNYKKKKEKKKDEIVFSSGMEERPPYKVRDSSGTSVDLLKGILAAELFDVRRLSLELAQLHIKLEEMSAATAAATAAAAAAVSSPSPSHLPSSPSSSTSTSPLTATGPTADSSPGFSTAAAAGGGGGSSNFPAPGNWRATSDGSYTTGATTTSSTSTSSTSATGMNVESCNGSSSSSSSPPVAPLFTGTAGLDSNDKGGSWHEVMTTMSRIGAIHAQLAGSRAAVLSCVRCFVPLLRAYGHKLGSTSELSEQPALLNHLCDCLNGILLLAHLLASSSATSSSSSSSTATATVTGTVPPLSSNSNPVVNNNNAISPNSYDNTAAATSSSASTIAAPATPEQREMEEEWLVQCGSSGFLLLCTTRLLTALHKHWSTRCNAGQQLAFMRVLEMVLCCHYCSSESSESSAASTSTTTTNKQQEQQQQQQQQLSSSSSSSLLPSLKPLPAGLYSSQVAKRCVLKLMSRLSSSHFKVASTALSCLQNPLLMHRFFLPDTHSSGGGGGGSISPSILPSSAPPASTQFPVLRFYRTGNGTLCAATREALMDTYVSYLRDNRSHWHPGIAGANDVAMDFLLERIDQLENSSCGDDDDDDGDRGSYGLDYDEEDE